MLLCLVVSAMQVLYEWASEAVDVFEAAKARHPDRAVFPRVPEVVFLIQAPGMHLKCIHMVRWLLVLDPTKAHASPAAHAPHFGSHFGTVARSPLGLVPPPRESSPGIAGQGSPTVAHSQVAAGKGPEGVAGPSAFLTTPSMRRATAASIGNGGPQLNPIYAGNF